MSAITFAEIVDYQCHGARSDGVTLVYHTTYLPVIAGFAAMASAVMFSHSPSARNTVINEDATTAKKSERNVEGQDVIVVH